MSGNDPPRRAQSSRFRMDGQWLLPLGVVETQEFLPRAWLETRFVGFFFAFSLLRNVKAWLFHRRGAASAPQPSAPRRREATT